MPTVPATGQFGPALFTVRSRNGVVVDAKWLTDITGASYIIDPNTGRPYIVPRDFEPSATAAYFSNALSEAVAIDKALGLGVSSVTAAIYPELKRAFEQGAPLDHSGSFAN